MVELSVIICTHTPIVDYLERTIDAIKKQTLGYDKWELLIIDNASAVPVNKLIDINWHPNSRHIREENLGLTFARIKGIKEAKSEFLLFVDDDNCLDSHYFEIAIESFRKNPLLGALGAGKILPEFEVEPIPEINEFTLMLALRDETRSYYSNEIKWGKAIPYGAGMVIRKKIALIYIEACEENLFANTLDRSGSSLLSGGDVDMALHACLHQFLVGVTPELKLIHIIPKTRLSYEYLVKIAAGHAYSHYMLGKMWGYLGNYPVNPILKKMRLLKNWFFKKRLSRLIMLAENKGYKDAEMAWKKTLAIR